MTTSDLSVLWGALAQFLSGASEALALLAFLAMASAGCYALRQGFRCLRKRRRTLQWNSPEYRRELRCRT